MTAKFMRLHFKKKPFLIEASTIKQVHVADKGAGSYIVTDEKENNIAADEDLETIHQYLVELDIEVELIANDT